MYAVLHIRWSTFWCMSGDRRTMVDGRVRGLASARGVAKLAPAQSPVVAGWCGGEVAMFRRWGAVASQRGPCGGGPRRRDSQIAGGTAGWLITMTNRHRRAQKTLEAGTNAFIIVCRGGVGTFGAELFDMDRRYLGTMSKPLW